MTKSESAGRADVVWNQCLERIREEINPQAFRTWFQPTRPLQLDDDRVLTIEVPTPFFYEWIEEHYYSVVRRSIVEVLGDQAQLIYNAVRDEATPEPPEDRSVTLPQAGNAGGVTGYSASERPATTISQQTVNTDYGYSGIDLNPRFTFDNFITGDCNQLAYAAAKAVAANPARNRFNPMVIYGGTGLGKTHLAQAIGHTILEKERGSRVIYTTSERFTLDFVESLQNKQSNSFINFYRSAAVLIVDDIQYFAGKEATQTNFFHTFNALIQAGNQIILTSDVPPKQLRDINDRLISRFQWGLTADMQPPDLETRTAILQKVSADEGYELPPDSIEYIARHVTGSVRELEGCLISLLAESSLRNIPLSLDLTKEVIGGIAPVSDEPVTIEEIQRAVSDHFDIPHSLLVGKSRKQEIVFARQMAMYLIRELTGASLKTVGNHFGGRDHTTVMHSIRTIENYLDEEHDRAVSGLNALKRTLKSGQ